MATKAALPWLLLMFLPLPPCSKSVLPDATPAKIGALLTKSSDDRGNPGWDSGYGAGIVNLSNLSVQDTLPANQPEKNQRPFCHAM